MKTSNIVKSGIKETTVSVISEYTDEEREFISKKAGRRGQSLEEYQKDSALNSSKKRFKDKRINTDLIKLTVILLETEDAARSGKKKELLESIEKIKGKVEEIQCYI